MFLWVVIKNVKQFQAYPSFCSMKRLGVFLLPSGWDASPSQDYPTVKFAATHLYTWVERSTVRVKCLAQEHNTMSPARARTRTARSGDERTNLEATAPLTQTVDYILYSNMVASHSVIIQLMVVLKKKLSLMTNILTI